MSLALIMLLPACRAGKKREVISSDPPKGEATHDSLAVAGRDGVEIWYTFVRGGRRPDGSDCLDRALELRRAGRRIPIPLLYTGETPRIVNETTARAVLYTSCHPGPSYLVDLRTGRPIREHR